MTDIDRRTFLKGLIGTTVVVAAAAPALAEAASRHHIGIDLGSGPDQTAVSVGRVDKATGVVELTGQVRPGDQVLITYTHNPKEQGIYEVTGVTVDGELVVARTHERQAGLVTHRIRSEWKLTAREFEEHVNRELKAAVEALPRTRRVKPCGGNTWHIGGDAANLDYQHGHLSLPAKRHTPSQYTWPEPRQRRGRGRHRGRGSRRTR